MEMHKERTVQRYVDILTNGGFKALFGDINNKEAVMAIINALLPEHRQVADIEYLPTERQGQMEDNKEYRYDFMCRDSSGAMFIVELQRYREKSWFKRCVSYAARAYDRQNRRGENYDVPPVYLIGLMGTEIDHPDREFWRDRYVSEYTFREKEAHDLLDETIVIIFAELVRFDKAESECTTDVDRMLFIKIFEACEIARFNEDKLIQFNKDMYDERRRNGELAAAIEEGMEKGIEKGRIDAMRRMLAAGISAEQVCAIMEVTPGEIAAMKKMIGM